MWNDFINWLESHMGECFYHKHFGIECPGCGMQRAFIALLRGEFIESLRLFPALIPIMFMLTYLILHLIFKYKNGAKVLKISFIFTILIIVINYIIKVINGNI